LLDPAFFELGLSKLATFSKLAGTKLSASPKLCKVAPLSINLEFSISLDFEGALRAGGWRAAVRAGGLVRRGGKRSECERGVPTIPRGPGQSNGASVGGTEGTEENEAGIKAPAGSMAAGSVMTSV
jgi:hypothetical protein